MEANAKPLSVAALCISLLSPFRVYFSREHVSRPLLTTSVRVHLTTRGPPGSRSRHLGIKRDAHNVSERRPGRLGL